MATVMDGARARTDVERDFMGATILFLETKGQS
jgi:hypothetical protein